MYPSVFRSLLALALGFQSLLNLAQAQTPDQHPTPAVVPESPAANSDQQLGVSESSLWDKSLGAAGDLWRDTKAGAGRWLEGSQQGAENLWQGSKQTAGDAWSSTRRYLGPDPRLLKRRSPSRNARPPYRSTAGLVKIRPAPRLKSTNFSTRLSPSSPPPPHRTIGSVSEAFSRRSHAPARTKRSIAVSGSLLPQIPFSKRR